MTADTGKVGEDTTRLTMPMDSSSSGFNPNTGDGHTRLVFDVPAGPEAQKTESVLPESPTPDSLLDRGPVSAKEAESIIEGEESAGISFSSLPPLLSGLINEGFFDIHLVAKIWRNAQGSGGTFLGVLANEKEIEKNEKEIFSWIARELGYGYEDVVSELVEQSMEAEWLRYAEAARVGAVLVWRENTGEKTYYATSDPLDLSVRDWISRMSELDAVPVVVPALVLKEVLQILMSRMGNMEKEEKAQVINVSTELEYEIRHDPTEASVPDIVDSLIQRGYEQKASDVHFEPTAMNLIVRNRIDGMLHEEEVLPRALVNGIVARIKIISNMDVVEKRRPQDGRITVSIHNQPIDIRVSAFPTVHGEKIVMRLLDPKALRPSILDLGFLDRDLQIIQDKVNAPYGLIMISGPTGSGKTTTLYSMLSSVDTEQKNVMTVEDPVEYRLHGVHQMNVNPKIGVTFASGLRTILRQDPDVVMVGECRDAETAGMAIKAALTGHIVFSTIHTNDAVGVVTRLLDLGVDPFLVSSALTTALAQRLVRRLCKCARLAPGSEVLSKLYDDGVSKAKLQKLGMVIDPEIGYPIKNGCPQCRNTGYSGRRAVFEMFEMTNEARAIILAESYQEDKLRKYVTSVGMTSLIKHGQHLVQHSQTSHEEIIRVLGETA